jgi:hypothetical protein
MSLIFIKDICYLLSSICCIFCVIITIGYILICAKSQTNSDINTRYEELTSEKSNTKEKTKTEIAEEKNDIIKQNTKQQIQENCVISDKYNICDKNNRHFKVEFVKEQNSNNVIGVFTFNRYTDIKLFFVYDNQLKYKLQKHINQYNVTQLIISWPNGSTELTSNRPINICKMDFYKDVLP